MKYSIKPTATAINTAVTVKASRNADKNAATKQNKRERCIFRFNSKK